MLLNKLFRLLGQICIVGLVFLGPWRNGGTEPWFTRIFLYLTICIGVCSLFSVLTTPTRERQKNSYFPALVVAIPLVLGLALGFLQICPFSDTTLRKFSPHILKLKQVLLPPEVDITLAQFSDETVRSELSEDLITSEFENVNQEFLFNAFPNLNIDKSDISKSLLLDRAIENEYLTNNHQTTSWGNCISVYPLVTKKSIPLFWSGFIVFLSSCLLFNTTKSRVFLLSFIAIFGGLYALLCILTQVNPYVIHEGFLKTFFDQYLISDSFGTYYNKNACGGYLVLLLGVSFILVINEYLKSSHIVADERKIRRQERLEVKEDSAYRIKNDALWKVIVSDFLDLFNRKLVFWLLVSSIIFAAIFLSLSRGATIAASISFLIVCLFLAFKKESRSFWYIFLTMLVVVVSLLCVTNTYDTVDERMSTVVEEDENGELLIEQDLRWTNWKNALDSSENYRWFGSGLGTYYISNRSNDVALKHNKLFYYAENVLIQTLLEMGIIGFFLLVLTYCLLLYFFGRSLHGRHSRYSIALSIGAIAIILGQLTASLGDFGNYLPANLLLFSILCGTVLGKQNLKQWEELNSALGNRNVAKRAIHKLELLKKREKIGCLIISILITVSLSGSLWMLHENSDLISRIKLISKAKSVSEDKLIYYTEEGLNNLIQDFQTFITARDDSYEMRKELSELEMKRFRLKSFHELKQKLRNDQDNSHEIDRLWANTSTVFLLETILKAQHVKFKVPVKTIRTNANVTEILRQSVMNRIAARRICPLFVESNRQIIMTLPLTTDLSFEDECLLSELYARRCVAFVPYNTYELFKNGCTLSYFRLFDLQKQCFNRTLQYSTLFTEPILAILEITQNRNDLERTVSEVIPNDYQKASSIYRKSNKSSNRNLIHQYIEKHTENVFNNTPEELRTADYYYQLAVFEETRKRLTEADEAYLQALKLAPYHSFYCLRRVKFLLKYHSILDKDEECLTFLQDVRPKLRGVNRWECDNLLEKAQKYALESRARKKAHEKIVKEREINQSIQSQ